MRISTFNAYENVVFNLQSRQKALQNSQEQLTSGKRVARPSDDPVAAARAERSLAEMTRADAHQRALEAARTNTQLTETALGDAGELIQRAREALMGAGNPSYTDNERSMLVQSLRGIREQLLSVANRPDGTGAYLFGGQGSAAPPFADAPGGVIYEGAAGSTLVASNESLSTTIDGDRTWLQAPAAVPGDPPLSIFNVLDNAITSLSTPGITDPQVATAVHDGVRDLDAFHDHLLGVRARTGEALNRMDQVELRVADAKLAAQTERSNAEDLDMVQAISDFQNRQTGYEAALKTYSMVQRMSLINYLG
ncbi:MAG: flagellar hook-associated protein FlgL [Rubrivivax sp.]|nr:flagellar hook-associated protein FlgL [Rubrivivax sp.]